MRRLACAFAVRMQQNEGFRVEAHIKESIMGFQGYIVDEILA